MGREATCILRLGSKSERGKALLETDFLLFRGTERLHIPFSAIEKAVAKDGTLHVRFSGKTAAFELGKGADAWARSITQPKGLVDKLGIAPGAKIALVGAFDDAFRRQVAAVTERVTEGARGKGHEHVLFAAEAAKDLARIGKLAGSIVPAGGVWVVYPKGQKTIREADVLAAGRAAGLKDVKVARFSETHTALRFVIPVAARGA